MLVQSWDQVYCPIPRTMTFKGRKWDLKEVQVNYDAIDTTVERIRRTGSLYYQTHCVIVGKVAKILYWKVRA